jgi:UrcA family protein
MHAGYGATHPIDVRIRTCFSWSFVWRIHRCDCRANRPAHLQLKEDPTMNRSLKFVLIPLLLASSAVATMGAQAAGSPATVGVGADGSRFQVVRYGDLDLESEAGNEALYRRLRGAAARVCSVPAHLARLGRSDENRCRNAALSRAVRAIGRNSLTAVYFDHGRRIA